MLNKKAKGGKEKRPCWRREKKNSAAKDLGGTAKIPIAQGKPPISP